MTRWSGVGHERSVGLTVCCSSEVVRPMGPKECGLAMTRVTAGASEPQSPGLRRSANRHDRCRPSCTYSSRGVGAHFWRWLMLPIVVALASAAYGAAQDRPQILGYTSSGSFWVELPDGWENDEGATKHFGAIFVLRPVGTTFDSAPFVVTGSSFDASSVEAAIKQDSKAFLERDPKMTITARAAVQAKKGGAFALREFRSGGLRRQGFETAAYIQLGPQVVVIVFSAQTEQNFNSGFPAFTDFLKTFEVSDIKVKVQK